MTTEEQISDLYTRVLALQEAVRRRGVQQDLQSIVETFNTELTTLTASITTLKALADEIASRCASLSENLEEHING